jgi:hypothetical protein
MQTISIETPDQFFTAQQQQRLKELISIWRNAQDRGEILSPEQQSELNNLIEAELDATTERAKAMLAQIQPNTSRLIDL